MPVKRAPKEPHTIDDFIDRILVVCPGCSSLATVTSTGRWKRARLRCKRCGLAKSREVTSYALGGTADPYFGLPLFLQASCSTHTLWAYNSEHLEFLQRYVGATYRRRPTRDAAGPLNSLLASRLPRWIQSSKHRDQILKTIAVIQTKLAAAG